MKRNDILERIRKRINNATTGTVFVTSDFADITDNKKTSVCLARLAGEKIIRRIMRGIYEKPEYNEFLGEFIEPSPDKIAFALARNYGWSIVPCGDAVLNLLGLSTQVPAVWNYVSDGPYKEYSYSNIVIKFKHTANKAVSKMGIKTSMVIQALKTLGKDNVDDRILQKISKTISTEEKKKMLVEAKVTTSWIYENIKTLAQEMDE